jgi:hypothetical protein
LNRDKEQGSMGNGGMFTRPNSTRLSAVKGDDRDFAPGFILVLPFAADVVARFAGPTLRICPRAKPLVAD